MGKAGAAERQLDDASWTGSSVGRLGKYDIIARLGQGGMSRVYLALAPGASEVRKLVVLKVLHDSHASNEEYLEMFLREARIAVDLAHPNVVHTYTVSEEDGRHCIVMEYIDGVPLSMVLRLAKDWTPRERLPLLGAICLALSGLHYVHEFRDIEGNHLRLVHRDLKPDNILLGFDGQVKLLDFGVVKMTAPEHDQTQSLSVKGTVQYLAPEALDTSRTIDRRYDIFAAGLVLWEALSGRRFWEGREPLQIMRALADDAMGEILAAGPELPVPLALAVTKALSANPDARQESALELRREIQRFLVSSSYRIDPDQMSGMLMRTFGDLRDERQARIKHMMRRLREGESSAETSLSTVAPLASTDETSSSDAEIDAAFDAVVERETDVTPASSSSTTDLEARPSEIRPLASTRPPRSFHPAVYALSLLLLGGVAWWQCSPEPADESDPVEASAPDGKTSNGASPADASKSATDSQMVEVRVEVRPPTATVTVDGVEQPSNPVTLRGREAATVHRVVASAPGFATQTLEVTLETSREIQLDLLRSREDPNEAAASNNDDAGDATESSDGPKKRKPRKPRPKASAKPSPPPAAPEPPAQAASKPRPGDDIDTNKKRKPKAAIDSSIPW